MVPIIYIGVISFFGSFSISNFITREILRAKMLDDNNNQNLKFNSKVKFNNEVRYLVIPSVRQLSSNNIKELWYSDDDYRKFKIEIINGVE